MELSYAQKESIGFAFVLDEMHCCSAWGRQRLRKAQPYAPGQKPQLLQELDNIQKTLRHRPAFEAEYARMEHLMMQIKDIRSSLEHISGPALGEVELFEVKRYLLQLRELAALFGSVNATAGYGGIAFADTAPALALLDPDGSGVASFHISERWSARLAGVRQEKKTLEQQLRAFADGPEKAGLLARRRELVAAEQEAEDAVRAQLTGQLRPWQRALLENAIAIAMLDVTLQKAKLAARTGAVMPRFEGEKLQFDAMVNPMLAARLREDGKTFTPVSIALSCGAAVITGANMGGKSVALKTLALNVYLAHSGFYCFAQSAALPLLAGLYLVSDDLEDTARGLSSFGGEIVRFGEICAALGTQPSLVLLDEFARGTNPNEGAAIAQSVCAYLAALPHYSVMSTHFDHVAAAATAHYQVAGLKNADIPALAQKLAGAPLSERVALIASEMDYGLYEVQPGAPPPRDAVHICRLLGIPGGIVESVEKLLTFGDK